MVSRGNFDELVRQETRRTVGSQRSADGGENARDRVARRLNQQEGRSPFKSSSAYKPTDDKPASKKRGAKSKGAGTTRGAPSGGRTSSTSYASTPQKGPIPPGKTDALPQVNPQDNNMLPLLIPILLSAMARNRGAGASAPGTDITFPAQEPTPVPLQRVPNEIDPNTGLPAPKAPLPLSGPPEALALPQQKLLPYYPGQADAVAPPDSFDAKAGRFFNEGEISDFTKAMPGVVKSPGWGPTKVKPGTYPHGVKP